MTSIWLRTDPDRPRRAPQLTRKLIVAAAVELLDSAGAEALTMRRLAERLGVTSTALYWHVRTKDDVLDLAVDEVFGEVALPTPTADWRADIRTLAHDWRAAMRTHPWTPALIGRPLIGPNVLARTEFLQATLVRGGLTGEGLAVATHLIADFVIGSAVTAAAWQPGARDRITAAAADYPTLAGSGHLDAAQWPGDHLFDRGLDILLSLNISMHLRAPSNPKR